MFTLVSFLWMPISIYVPAMTFNQVTGVDMQIITPTVCIICIFYTCIGGIKGVIWTDVLQGFIMIASLLLVVIKGTISVGGLGVVVQRNWASGRLEAPTVTLDPTVRMSFFSVFVGGALFKLQAVKKALISSLLGFIFLLGLCIYLGLLAFAYFHDCDPITTKLARAKDQVVPLYVMEVASEYPGITGLFVAGVFSAALSSLSTVLNSLSGVVLKDFVEPYRKQPLTERQTAYILRSVVVLFGLISMFMVRLVDKLGLVMQLSATVGSMTAGPLLGLFTVGMVMPFVNTRSVLTGCSAAFSLMGYIVVRAQFAIAAGELRAPTKPVSTEGCTYDFFRPTDSSLLDDAPMEPVSKGLHHISFLWYTALGAFTTIIVSLLASIIFGWQDINDVDPMLVIPQWRRYIKPKAYAPVAEREKEPEEKEELTLDPLNNAEHQN